MKELNFETSIKELEEIVSKLEKGDIELDKAYELFEKGIILAKNCENKLKNIENKVNKIIEDGKEKDLRIEESEE